MLYLCATPIGNLEDMTFRAIRILREADLIAAEDTRRTRQLLTHFDIHKPLIRFDANCSASVGARLLERLRAGETIAVVSDAGLPAISDPGSDLVRLAIDANIPVCPIPGANAALTALICSGLDTTQFLFAGFAPKSKKNRREFLQRLVPYEATLIFYEAPHRLKDFLADLTEAFGDRRAVLARELTKIHEEFLRGNLTELIERVVEPRGEFVVLVEGNKVVTPAEDAAGDWKEFYLKLLERGLDKKSAMRETAKLFKMSRREIYNTLLKEDNA